MANLHQGQFAVRPKGSEKCIHHQEIVQLYCIHCHDLACVRCVPTIHSDHRLSDLKDVIPGIKQEVKTFIDDTEWSKLPEIRQAKALAQNMLKEDKDHFDDLKYQVIKVIEKLKRDLDSLSASILSSYQNLRDKNVEIVNKYIKELGAREKDFEEYLTECRKVIEAGSWIFLYDVMNEIRSLKVLPDKPILGNASFTPNMNPLDHLKQSIGMLTFNHPKSPTQVEVEQKVITSPSSTQHELTGLNQPSSMQQQYKSANQDKTEIKPSLQTHTKFVTEFTPKCRIEALCPTNDGQVFVKDYNRIRLFSTTGELRQMFEYKVRISDSRTSPTTQNIWTCSDRDCSVMENSPSGTPVFRFKLDEEPLCICVSVNEYVIIGVSNQIRKYTTDVKKLVTTKFSQSEPSVVTTPERISECSETYNVAVVDLDHKNDGGADKPHVVVMDRNLKEIFRYRGDIPTKYQQNIRGKPPSFYPWDARYDCVGNLVISDRASGNLHLISGSGAYLSLIYTDTHGLYSIGIGSDNIIWVHTWPGKVKLLKYNYSDV